MNNLKLLVFLLLFLPLIACSDKDSGEQVSSPDKSIHKDIKRKSDFKVTDPTTLRKTLPINAVAYVRIPNMLSFMSAVKGDAFSEAMQDKAHVELIKKLRVSIEKNVFSNEVIVNNPILLVMLKYMQSPLELAVLPSANQLPIPNVLITTKFNISSIDELNKILEDAAAKSINVHIRRPVSDKGPGFLMSGPVPILIEYNNASGMLRVMAGLTVDEQVFKATIADLKQSPDHPMYVSESKIDDSHHGMFVWVNMQQVLPIMKATMPPEKVQELESRGITKIESISLGWGVSNEKGRMKALLQMPRTGFREFIYPVANDIQIQSSGTPRAVVSLSLPASSQLGEIETSLQQSMDDVSYEKYRNGKSAFFKKTGLNYEDILNAFGPELMVLADKAGEYVVLRIRDKDTYKTVLENLIVAGNGKISSRKYKGIHLRHVTFPSIFSFARNKKTTALAAKNHLFDLLQKGKSHMYWIEEDDYLIAANLPQMLIDRNNYTNKISVNQWLQVKQKQDISSSLLMMSTNVKDAHRKLYYAYIQLLMYLGDLADTELDVHALPTALELDFPEAGTYGLQVDSSDSSLGIEFTFENNPMEILIGQDISSVAVVGILAAIAIPAYNDYTIRAQLTSAIALTMQERRAVMDYFNKQGKFPSAIAIKQLGLNKMPGKVLPGLTILPDTGAIEIKIIGKSSINGKILTLTPHFVGESINWKCGGAIAPKYFPRSCR